MLEEIDRQREEVHARDEELKKAQKEALDRVESLCASGEKKDKCLTEYSKQVQELRQQIDSLKLSYSLELGKFSQSAKDISTLQQDLKEKDKTIDKMKSAGSSLKTMLSSAQQKIQDLEAEKVALNRELQVSQGRLQNLESFTVQQLEKLMKV